jgi:hypothetical protein
VIIRSTAQMTIMFTCVILIVAGCRPGSNPSQSPASDTSTQTASSDIHATESHHDHGGHQHEKHEHAVASSYDDAVRKLASLCEEIDAAFAEKDIDRAHDPIHEVGHLLEQLPNLASSSIESDNEMARAKKAIDQLFDCFGQIDEKLHQGQEVRYSEFKPSIDAAVKELVANKTPIKE